MNIANQERSDAGRSTQALASNYQHVMENWAEVSKCCFAAADDIYRTGIDYIRDQAEQLQEITRDPRAAMREQTYTQVINCSFDAADKIAQTYLHSLETVREPLMRAVAAQLPIARSMSGAMERGMQQGMDFMERGAERMEETARSATRMAERGADETQQQQPHRPQHQQQQHGGKRKSA